MKAVVTKTLEIELSVKDVAEWFAGIDDESQAQFFIEVAKIADTWPKPPDYQWFSVGRHLRDCECSTDSARDLVSAINGGIEP